MRLIGLTWVWSEEVSLLLKNVESLRLEAKIGLKVVGDLTDKSLEWLLVEEELGQLLVGIRISGNRKFCGSWFRTSSVFRTASSWFWKLSSNWRRRPESWSRHLRLAMGIRLPKFRIIGFSDNQKFQLSDIRFFRIAALQNNQRIVWHDHCTHCNRSLHSLA